MTKPLYVLALLGLALTAPAEECGSLDAVDWILGDWITSPDRVVIREHWHRVSDATFEGETTTRSADDGAVVSYESLRLVAMSGRVFYIAKVAHNDLPVPFRLTGCSDGMAIFENPDHDAPQRLTYRRLHASAPGAAELEVRVEGGDMTAFSLLFHRP